MILWLLPQPKVVMQYTPSGTDCEVVVVLDVVVFVLDVVVAPRVVVALAVEAVTDGC